MIDCVGEKCVGCEGCGNICPFDAITFKIKNGFRYPNVDKNKCIECNLCRKVCPVLNNTNSNLNFVVYAAWSKDSKQRKNCTSGGLCYEISKKVIEEGGYVAGVVWTSDYKNARYELIHEINDLDKITQTKYFQPQMNNIYFKIKELLENGKTVLYIGSSCTNDALKNYLGKNYDRLYCIDYICRGYTSQIYHEKRIIDIENKYSSKVIAVQYKNKTLGWKDFGTKFWLDNGREIFISRFDDPYELMFKVDDYNTRPSCYECKYRQLPRHTDITVGDFWGIKDVKPEDYYLGISVAIVSSTKGRRLMEKISERIVSVQHDIQDVSNGNRALLNQLNRKEGAEQFFKDLDRLSFTKFNNKYASKRIIKMKRWSQIIKTMCKCNMLLFVYYNFICKSVQRRKKKYIFPLHGSRIELDPKSKVILNDSLYLNTPKHLHSKEECYLKVMPDAILEVNGICKFAANNTIEVLSNARLIVGRLDSNYGTTIICGNQISIGNDVGIGRNVTIYDNNFHPTRMNSSRKTKPLIIEDHVWLCTGVTIAKGIKIEQGAVCSINSTVTRNIKAKNMVSGNPAKVVMSNFEW